MHSNTKMLLLAAAIGTSAISAKAEVTLTVGPGGQYQRISDAAAAANADTDLNNYYVINVAPGTYQNDFPEVTRPMAIQVDPAQAGQQVLLQATIPLPNQKGIILTFASLRVNGLTFIGANIANSLGGNGAGIRDQNTADGATLTVENSIFVGNQEGILTGYDSSETITIVNSRFINNGNPDPNYFQHALYVNNAGSLTVTDSLFCGQLIGHNIKSRALITTVTNNRIYDGQADDADGCGPGSSSFAIDMPEGGIVTISGNQLIQGAASPNYKLVVYGEEGLSYSNNSLSVSNNSFINFAPNATGVYDPYCVPAILTNNTFQGVPTPVNPASCAVYQEATNGTTGVSPNGQRDYIRGRR
jgi:hypothetical protein